MVTETDGTEALEKFRKRMRRGFKEENLPAHMLDGLMLYLERGIRPGGFLTAVIQNNLAEAAMHADNMNQMRLFEWAAFMYHHAPSQSWGSPMDYMKWMERGGLLGREEADDGDE